MKKVYRVEILTGHEEDLGDSAVILFILPNGAEIECSHTRGMSPEGLLEVRAKNGRLRVMPRVDNVINIEVDSPENPRPEFRKKRKA